MSELVTAAQEKASDCAIRQHADCGHDSLVRWHPESVVIIGSDGRSLGVYSANYELGVTALAHPRAGDVSA